MSTSEGTVAVLCCWAGNRWSSVTPAVRHRLDAVSTCEFIGLGNEERHLCCCRNMGPLYLTVIHSNLLLMAVFCPMPVY